MSHVSTHLANSQLLFQTVFSRMPAVKPSTWEERVWLRVEQRAGCLLSIIIMSLSGTKMRLVGMQPIMRDLGFLS